MRNRAERTGAKQAGAVAAIEQLRLLPMIAGTARSKQALMEWVHQLGLAALTRRAWRPRPKVAARVVRARARRAATWSRA